MMRKSLLFIAFATGLAQPALAQPARAPGDTNGAYVGQSRGSNFKGVLTPEQQAMWMRESHVGSNPADQEAWRRQQSEKLAGMSATDRQKLVTRLQTAFDQLPQREKDRIHQQMAARMTQQDSGVR